MDYKALHKELQMRTSRSSGSGGQHVNKVETKVELLFDLDSSQVLTEAQKQRIRKVLGGRITKDGQLVVASSNRRSQTLNRSAALKKFDRLIKDALRPRKRRKPTGKFKAHPEKRLEAKKRKAEKKARRRQPIPRNNDGF